MDHPIPPKSKYSSAPLLLLILAWLTLTSAQLEPFEFESEKLGRIRGSISSTSAETPYYQFQGIPYGDVDANGRFLVIRFLFSYLHFLNFSARYLIFKFHLQPSVLKTGKLVEDGQTFDATSPGDICIQRNVASASDHTVGFESVGLFSAFGGVTRNVSERSETVASGAENCLFINVFTRDVSGLSLH